MHRDRKLKKKFLRRGHSPLNPDPSPIGRGTPPASAPTAPRFSRLRRSTCCPSTFIIPPPISHFWLWLHAGTSLVVLISRLLSVHAITLIYAKLRQHAACFSTDAVIYASQMLDTPNYKRPLCLWPLRSHRWILEILFFEYIYYEYRTIVQIRNENKKKTKKYTSPQ